MGRVRVGALLAAVAVAGCGGGGAAVLRAGSVDDAPRGIPVTATATPTALPGGPHSTMLVCPKRPGQARAVGFVLR
jgi:hypothetical protein